MSFSRVFVCFFGLGFALLSNSLVFASSEDQALEQFYREHLERWLKQNPVDATRLGDHRYDQLLDDLSPRARQERLDEAKKTLRDLPRRVNYRRLSRGGQIDFEILQHELETGIWIEENTRPYEQNPRLYNGYISDSVFLLFTQSNLPKETNVANAIARIRQIPKITAAARQTLKNPPRAVLETAILQNQGSIGFYEKGLFELVGETSQAQALKSAASAIVPVLKDYQRFLESELLPNATGDWRLGKRKFARKLEMVLDAGLTAEQVLAEARAEFQRVRSEMYVFARQLWSQYFPDRTLPVDDPAGQKETVQRVLAAVSQEHGRPEDLVEDARATVDRIKRFIAQKDILRLPEPDRCAIIEMPEFHRGNSVAYLNSAPPLDPATASYYAISPPAADWPPERAKSLLEEYNSHMLQILTIHEAYPGHYVQLEYANRVPSLIRRVLGSGVFAEGWAVYTEQMLLDEGYGERNLPLRLTQLKFYLRAVGNAILDHEMHCREMSDEEALRFLTEEAFQSEQEARLKIVRAKQTSVQLSTYFVGRMAFVNLRRQIQRDLGEKFNLGRYHETVLAHGSVPVKYLPELTRRGLPR